MTVESPTSPSLQSLLDFAIDAAWQAGRITLRYYQTPLRVDRKSDNSPVTIADRESEQKLREMIAHYWPAHGIIGEEFGETAPHAEYTWIIDPIDGTKSFIHGIPFYSVLVALVKDKQPIVGVMSFPALNEVIYAGRGLGCYWNGRRARVSDLGDLSQATFLMTEIPSSKHTWRGAFQRLVDATAVQRTWCDAYAYAMVATGRAEVVIDPVMQVWDCAPLQPILEEAGGRFTDFKGDATIYGGSAFATNNAVFDAAFALLK
jgi:histidinol phosphatase-like enzyme (inositol monophosphatase family)